MKFKLEEAETLYNNRVAQTGKGVKMTKVKLGSLLYPTAKQPNTHLFHLMKKDVTSVKVEQLQLICKALKVDPNFLFGYPSMYDTENEKLK